MYVSSYCSSDSSKVSANAA